VKDAAGPSLVSAQYIMMKIFLAQENI